MKLPKGTRKPRKPPRDLPGGGERNTVVLSCLNRQEEGKETLDSLGSFFNHLIDIDYHQDVTGTSEAIEEEVTIISFDSEPLPRQKIRRVTRKVSFSHPLAHLDPHFILKQQQHESRQQTRTSGGEELSFGLPNTPTPRKRLNEVIPNLNSFYSLAVLIRQPLNSSDSNYQETSGSSSGDSSQSQLPAFKTAPG